MKTTKKIKTNTDTKLVHEGFEKNTFNAAAEPIYRTSTFIFDNVDQGAQRFLGKEEGYIYSRLGNPTNRVLEIKLAALEHAEDCAVTASGMGAIAACMWTFLKAGDHMLADEALYGCTFALFTHLLTKFGVQVELINMSNIENVKKHLKSNTTLVYFETPTNPQLRLNDIQEIATIAHKYNPKIKVIVDNTFASPILQNPIVLGADIVVHSMTKYINGHGDAICGCVCGTKKDIADIKMIGIKDATGSVLSADDAYIINRGLKTLSVRMKKHVENAKAIVEFLKQSPYVKNVYYPGINNNEDVFKKQMRAGSGVLAFETKLTFEQTKTFVNNLHVITLAVSLGGVESLIEHPASMTHSTYTPEALKEASITPTLIRLSVGIEDTNDLINDLKDAFEYAAKS